MPDTSARLQLPFILPGQAQKHVTHNEALLVLDGMVQLVLEEIDALVPPASPSTGAIYAVGASAQEAWAGQGGQLAQWSAGSWQFLTPQEGWQAWVRASSALCILQGGTWSALSVSSDFNALEGVGIGTTSDAVNRLAVASEASLLTHAGAGHQVKVNKATAGDTASLVYQSGWTGHAELGLTGDTDFHLKVSEDGASWIEALVVDTATGRLHGEAVQDTPRDTTAGRMMGVGAFGLGAHFSYTAVDDLDTIAPGFFGNASSASIPAHSPKPSGRWAGFYASANKHVGLQIAQKGDGVGELYTRKKGFNDDWGDWYKMFTQANVVGPVSQVAGVPTGALIEEGETAQGAYVRFADGTQLCSAELTSTTANGAYDWTFPNSFVAPPAVTATALYAGGMRFACLEGITATQAGVRTCDMTGDESVTPGVRLIALGRWV